ncbi:hypothetical protein J2799_000362 [Chryseobacterium vietnamense]|nr:hypothetical protein [Chryseobacterium vietnamense]
MIIMNKKTETASNEAVFFIYRKYFFHPYNFFRLK